MKTTYVLFETYMWNENIDVPLMHVTWFKLQEMCHSMRIKYMFLVLAFAIIFLTLTSEYFGQEEIKYF